MWLHLIYKGIHVRAFPVVSVCLGNMNESFPVGIDQLMASEVAARSLFMQLYHVCRSSLGQLESRSVYVHPLCWYP